MTKPTASPTGDERRAVDGSAPGLIRRSCPPVGDPLLAVCPSCRREAASVWTDWPDGTRIAVCIGCCPPVQIPVELMADG